MKTIRDLIDASSDVTYSTAALDFEPTPWINGPSMPLIMSVGEYCRLFPQVARRGPDMPVEYHITFDAPGDFEALELAREWLAANGYTLGSAQRGHPTAVYRAEEWGGGSDKWTRIKNRDLLPGRLTGDTRHGPLHLRLKVTP